MARGQVAKEEITKKILSVFENSFQYEKEIRIPFYEDGELIQVKCVLTASKTNVECGDENLIPGNIVVNKTETKEISKEIVEPTQEEKDNVERLLKSLGL